MDVTSLAPFSKVECPACGAHTRVKREFGPYTLRQRLAIGGMSVVFTAHDNTLDREVALKILNENYSADERRISAFEEEARLTASLSHPHVVRVLTTGRAFGRFYIAMELVSGGHFEHQIRERGKIPEAEMLPMAIEVAQGLKAAHDAGLIHRDVKPGNILLDAKGNVKIVDFGLALVTKGGEAQATELWATPYYVPPETIEGYPEDFRSDIYAFGATLYHALAGRPSCGEETMATDLLRESKKKVIPLGQLEPGLSAEICGIVDKAMAYQPKDRFSSYEEMIAALDVAHKRLKSNAGGDVESARSATKRQNRRRRNEITAMIMAALVVAVSATIGILWVTRGGGEKPKIPAPPVVAVEQPLDLSDIPTDVSSRYDEARAAVVAGDFETAARNFDRLRDNSDVQEPSRTWAGIEAVMAAYLNGEAAKARKLARLAVDHAENAGDGVDAIKSGLLPVLSDLHRLAPFQPEGPVKQQLDSVTAARWMISALKNWEQGMLDEAVVFFSAMSDTPLAPDSDWMAIYQNHSRNYLEDHKLLTSQVFADFPVDKEGCDRAISELAEKQVRLKTRGRAKFNISAWQLELSRHGNLLGKAVAPPPPARPVQIDMPVVLAVLKNKAQKCEFQQAAEHVKSLKGRLPEESQVSLYLLTVSAATFLTDLEKDLKAPDLPQTVRLKAGGVLNGITADESGNLRDSAGRLVRWADVEPDSLIELHRNFVRTPANEDERLRRHGCAIAFDWLAGDKNRAEAAASRLAAENPQFRNLWEKIAVGLPE
jgi:serine/threonine protein kinase